MNRALRSANCPYSLTAPSRERGVTRFLLKHSIGRQLLGQEWLKDTSTRSLRIQGDMYLVYLQFCCCRLDFDLGARVRRSHGWSRRSSGRGRSILHTTTMSNKPRFALSSIQVAFAAVLGRSGEFLVEVGLHDLKGWYVEDFFFISQNVWVHE